MTTDMPDDRASPKPQVIELGAGDYQSDTDEGQDHRTADAEATSRGPGSHGLKSQGPAAHRSRWPIGLAVALVIGLVAGGWLYRGLLSTYLPSDRMTALADQVAALQQNTADLAAELGGVRQQSETAAQAAANAAQNNTTATDAAAALATRISAMDQRLAGAETQLGSLQADIEALKATIAAAPPASAGAGGADGTALAALGARIDALEKDVAGLRPAAGGTLPGETAALTAALAGLKASIAAGAAYQADYDVLARLVPAAAGLEVLAAHAATGLPDAQALARQLRELATALPPPVSPATRMDGYAGWLLDSLSGIITIRPIGETDWAQLAEKAAALAEAGDLSEAVAALGSGEGESPAALRQWQDQAAARLALERAAAQLSDAVLRQITAMGSAAQ